MFIKRGITGLRGIGDATCPSDEQLAGIQDCTDPCQASSAPCITTTPATTTTAGTLSAAAFAVQCAAQGGQISASGNSCTTPGTSSIAGISPSLIAVGGGLLFLLLLLGREIIYACFVGAFLKDGSQVEAFPRARAEAADRSM